MISINLDGIKPPWVHKLDFYRMPFNYCDHWCAKCQFTSICRVYKAEQQRTKKLLRDGKNPHDIDNIFNTLAANLKKTTRMIVEEAKKRGISLDDVASNVKVVEVKPEDYPLVKLTEKFFTKLHVFLENSFELLHEKPVRTIEQQFEIVNYYHFLITGKVLRAVMSSLEEQKMNEEPYDSKNSAFIAVTSLVKISEALTLLARYAPLRPLSSTAVKHAKTALSLARLLDSEFDLEMI